MESSCIKRDIKDIKAIIGYCGKIGDALTEFGNDESDFMENYFFQSTCSFSILQIGELAKSLSRRGFCEKHPDVEWSRIAKFRMPLRINTAK